MTAGAVAQTSAELRRKLVALAAHLLEAAEADIDLAHGQASVRGDPVGLPFAVLADRGTLARGTCAAEPGHRGTRNCMPPSTTSTWAVA